MHTFLRHTIFFCVLVLSLTATATEGDVIDIVFAGAEAQVAIPATADVTYTANGAYVTINSSTTTEEYTYRVTGSTTDGKLVINGSYKLTLLLAGVNIISNDGAAIDVQCGKRIAVVLDGGKVNTLTDATGGSHKGALYFSGHPEFEGEGTLNVTGRTKHAIAAKEYLQLKKTTGTINVLSAVGDGIHCGKGKENNEHRYFQMSGGIVNIANVQGDGIDSDDYGIMNIKGGVINVNVSTDEGCGLKCDSILYMGGGEVNINVTGTDAEGMRTNYDARLTGGTINISVGGDGSKGIRSKNSNKSVVQNGGFLHFDGTDVNIWLHAANILAADGTIDTHCRAISADADMTRIAGDIQVYAYGTMSNPCHVDGQETITGGTLTVHQAPWPFYYANFQHDMTSYIRLKINEQTASLSDYAVGAFIGTQCVGVAQDDYLRIYSPDGSSQEVTFKACRLSDETTCDLTASSPVIFSANAMAATATSPLLLQGTTKVDVNRDGVNLDFSQGTPISNAQGGICTYAKDMMPNTNGTLSGMQPIEGWNIVNNGDARAAGIFNYGSTVWVGGPGYLPPATGPEGQTTGQALGLVAVWTADVQYTQDIVLSEGTYTITVPIYHSVDGSNSNRLDPLKSLIGFIADDGTEYLAEPKYYPVNTWTTESITFTLSSQTTGRLSLGYVAPKIGSDKMPHYFIDHVSIKKHQPDIPVNNQSLQSSPSSNGFLFDLSGHRISLPSARTKGIYITQGKKVFLK